MTENAPLSPEEIERLKTLLEKAGSGHVFVYRGEDGEAIAIADLATRRDICRFGVPHRKITREWIEGHAELLAGVLNALPALLARADAPLARVDRAQKLEAGLRDMLPYAEAGTWRVLPDKIRALLAEIEAGRAGAERVRALENALADQEKIKAGMMDEINFFRTELAALRQPAQPADGARRCSNCREPMLSDEDDLCGTCGWGNPPYAEGPK